MLVPCRLAGLSALEGYYAGLMAFAQYGPTQSTIAAQPHPFTIASNASGTRFGAPSRLRPMFLRQILSIATTP